MQPHPQNRQQSFGIDRFGEIIGRSWFETFFAVAFHRFRGQRGKRLKAWSQAETITLPSE